MTLLFFNIAIEAMAHIDIDDFPSYKPLLIVDVPAGYVQ